MTIMMTVPTGTPKQIDLGQLENVRVVGADSDELKDGEDVAYGAYNKDTDEILLNQDLVEKARTDKDAAALLLGVLKEELTHREARAYEQALDIQDYQYDEGAYAAREMLKALGEEGTDVLFSFAIGDDAYAFETSADAIGNAVDSHFGMARILADRQTGALELVIIWTVIVREETVVSCSNLRRMIE